MSEQDLDQPTEEVALAEPDTDQSQQDTETAPAQHGEEDYRNAVPKDLHAQNGTVPDNTHQAEAQDINLDVILDVPVNISVEIGRRQVPIRDLLHYTQGSVIELERMVDEPLDVLVNNTLIAHGEVVVVDERFGIRLTDVISPSERIKKLK